jgi:hypothetical protein
MQQTDETSSQAPEIRSMLLAAEEGGKITA